MEKEEVFELIVIDETNFKSFQPFVPDEYAPAVLESRLGAVGAVLDNVPCGAAIYGLRDVTAEIFNVYVAENYRRQLIGTTMVCEILDTLEELGGIEAVTASFFDENGAGDFFKSMKFTLEEDETAVYSFKTDELSDCKFMQISDELANKFTVMSVAELPDAMLDSINDVLKANGIDYIGEITKESVIPEISMACYEKDELCGFIAFSGENELEITSLYIKPNATSHLMVMMMKAAKKLTEKYPPATTVRITVLEPSSEKTLKLLLGDKITVLSKGYTATFVLG